MVVTPMTWESSWKTTLIAGPIAQCGIVFFMMMKPTGRFQGIADDQGTIRG